MDKAFIVGDQDHAVRITSAAEFEQAYKRVRDLSIRTTAGVLEDLYRAIIVATLPRGLKWLARRPRLLAILYRVRPTLRPIVSHRIAGPDEVISWTRGG